MLTPKGSKLMSFDYIIPTNNEKIKLLSKISVHKNVVTLYFSEQASQHKQIFYFFNLTKVFRLIHQNDNSIHDILHSDESEKTVFHHHIRYELVNIIEFHHLKDIFDFFAISLKQAIDEVIPGACWLDKDDWQNLKTNYEKYLAETYCKENITSEILRKNSLQLAFNEVNKHNHSGVKLLQGNPSASTAKTALQHFDIAFELLTKITPIAQTEFKEIKDRIATLNINRGTAYNYFDVLTAYEFFSEAYAQRRILYGEDNLLTKKAAAKVEACKNEVNNFQKNPSQYPEHINHLMKELKF